MCGCHLHSDCNLFLLLELSLLKSLDGKTTKTLQSFSIQAKIDRKSNKNILISLRKFIESLIGFKAFLFKYLLLRKKMISQMNLSTQLAI